MGYAAAIIDKFGGVRKTARALNLAPTTVQGWKDAGLIPAKHHQAVLDKASETGVPISPADFFDLSETNSIESCTREDAA